MKKTASRVFGFLSANMTIVYFLVILSFALIFYPNFANSNNIKALIRQAPMPIIRGLAVSFILVLGNVDLSLGYIVGFVSVTQGMLLDAGVAPALTILIGLATVSYTHPSLSTTWRGPRVARASSMRRGSRSPVSAMPSM